MGRQGRNPRASAGGWDLLVVGGGPAGVAAACQAHRDGLRACLVEAGRLGGSLWAAGRLTNLADLGAATGPELARLLARRLDAAGVATLRGRMVLLEAYQAGWVGRVDSGEQVSARSAVLAVGLVPVAVEIPGWEDVERAGLGLRDGRSLSGELGGRRVLVVGGGEVALDTALNLWERGANVEVWTRSGRFRAWGGLVGRFRTAGVPAFRAGAVRRFQVTGGGVSVSAQEREGVFDKVVLAIGRRVRLDFLDDPGPAELAARTGRQEVRPGLYLAGDVCAASGERYVAWALGSGQRAARLAAVYLNSLGLEAGP